MIIGYIQINHINNEKDTRPYPDVEGKSIQYLDLADMLDECHINPTRIMYQHGGSAMIPFESEEKLIGNFSKMQKIMGNQYIVKRFGKCKIR